MTAVVDAVVVVVEIADEVVVEMDVDVVAAVAVANPIQLWGLSAATLVG